MAIDEIALSTFIESAVAELSASFSAPLILVGDRLGLYKAMAGAGPLTPAQLAESTGTTERYVREWLCNQAASRYVTYDPTAGTFTLTDEAAFCLADEDSPVFMPGGQFSGRKPQRCTMPAAALLKFETQMLSFPSTETAHPGSVS